MSKLRIGVPVWVVLLVAGATLAQHELLDVAPDPKWGIRVAKIDLERILEQSAAGRGLRELLEEFQRQVRVEGQSMAERAQVTKKQWEDGGRSLSRERLSQLRRQLDDETSAIRRFKDDKMLEGRKIQQEGLQEIEESLLPFVQQVQTEGGYDLILNSVSGSVIFASDRIVGDPQRTAERVRGDAVDITDRVRELFDGSAEELVGRFAAEAARYRQLAMAAEREASAVLGPMLALHAVELSPSTVAPGEAMTLEWDLTATGAAGVETVEVELSYVILKDGSPVHESGWRPIEIGSGNRTRKSIRVRTGSALGSYNLVATARLGELEKTAKKEFRVQ